MGRPGTGHLATIPATVRQRRARKPDALLVQSEIVGESAGDGPAHRRPRHWRALGEEQWSTVMTSDMEQAKYWHKLN